MRFFGKMLRKRGRILLVVLSSLLFATPNQSEARGPTNARTRFMAPPPKAAPKPVKPTMAQRKEIRQANRVEKKQLRQDISGLNKQNNQLGKQNQAFGKEKVKLGKENVQLTKEKSKLEQQKGKLENQKDQADKKLSAAQARRNDSAIKRDEAKNPVSKAFYRAQAKNRQADVNKAGEKVGRLETKIGDKQAAIRGKENDIGARNRAVDRIGVQQGKNNAQIRDNRSDINSKQARLGDIKRDPSRSLPVKGDPNQKPMTGPAMGSSASSTAQAKPLADPPSLKAPADALPSLSTPVNGLSNKNTASGGSQGQGPGASQKTAASENPPPPRDDDAKLWKGVQRPLVAGSVDKAPANPQKAQFGTIRNGKMGGEKVAGADAADSKPAPNKRPLPSAPNASGDASPPVTPPALKKQRTEVAVQPAPAGGNPALAGKGPPPPPPSANTATANPPPAPPPPAVTQKTVIPPVAPPPPPVAQRPSAQGPNPSGQAASQGSTGAAGGNGRSALLADIQKGTQLKKVDTGGSGGGSKQASGASSDGDGLQGALANHPMLGRKSSSSSVPGKRDDKHDDDGWGDTPGPSGSKQTSAAIVKPSGSGTQAASSTGSTGQTRPTAATSVPASTGEGSPSASVGGGSAARQSSSSDLKASSSGQSPAAAEAKPEKSLADHMAARRKASGEDEHDYNNNDD